MKFLLFFILLISTAYGEQKNAPKFEEIKPKIIAQLEQRINMLQTQKSCVLATTSKQQLKACYDSYKDLMGKKRDEMRKLKK